MQPTAVVLAASLFCISSVLAQKPVTPAPTAPNPGIGNPGPSRTPNTNPNTFPQSNNPNNPNNQMITRPVFLSGKVVLQDGTPPPDQVRIEKVCGAGSARGQAYTDRKGRFQFQLDNAPEMQIDASESSLGSYPSNGGMMGSQRNSMGGMGNRSLAGCDLRAVLPGYRSETVSLAMHSAFDNPDVGTIVLHRLAHVEGTTISMTSLNAPKDAQKAFDKGREQLKKDKTEEAEKNFQKAVDIYPQYAVAWYELGRLENARKQSDAASQSFQKAIDSDKKFVSPYLDLALIATQAGKWDTAAELTDRIVKLNPVDFPQAYFYNSVANYNLKNMEAAEKSAREAAKLDTQHRMPKVEHLLGTILAQKQDYTGAASRLKAYLQFAPNATDSQAVRAQLAEIEKIASAVKPVDPQ